MANAQSVEILINAVIQREGGYVDHPDDRGGPTRWGVTENVARENGYIGPMSALPKIEAQRIYRHLYWENPGFDTIATIAPIIAAECFDTAVNMGPSVAVGFLQRALNALNRNARDYSDIAVDRAIGPATIAALKGLMATREADSEPVLLKAMEALQGERYIALAEARPANESFAFGWIKHRIG
ncbi:MAG: glycosyl hydrolase 108 family protein [Pseudomonadota bacterium]